MYHLSELRRIASHIHFNDFDSEKFAGISFRHLWLITFTRKFYCKVTTKIINSLSFLRCSLKGVLHHSVRLIDQYKQKSYFMEV